MFIFWKNTRRALFTDILGNYILCFNNILGKYAVEALKQYKSYAIDTRSQVSLNRTKKKKGIHLCWGKDE